MAISSPIFVQFRIAVDRSSSDGIDTLCTSSLCITSCLIALWRVMFIPKQMNTTSAKRNSAETKFIQQVLIVMGVVHRGKVCYIRLRC